ncbi:uncharacterized protein CBL_00823 [Carabus blaptoides fortunei]
MFKFGFTGSDNEQDGEKESNVKEWHEAKEISPDICKYDIKESSVQNFTCIDISIKYISPSFVIDHLTQSEKSNCILKAETDHSDLVSAEYEGGLKIWECTTDLVNFLHEKFINFSNKRVLDLGCGAGILGLFTLLKGARVDFQDYNEEVIEYTTIPNVYLNNNSNTEYLSNSKFYSGDWKSFLTVTTSKYDYILTSETIYNPENYKKLIDVFIELLDDNGKIYLAAKTYYFGVGGGIRQFEELLRKNQILTSSVCWKTSDGVQREILEICKK